MRKIVEFKCNTDLFDRWVRDCVAKSGKMMYEGWRDETRLLAGELIKLTPPFTGRKLVRMLAARPLNRFGGQPQLSEPEIAEMSALQIGKRRVEKDIRKVIYGLEGPRKGLHISKRHYSVSKGSNPNETDWGTLQKCQGRQAVRVFATKTGDVYGADLSEWVPNADKSTLQKHHFAQRTKRGRVTTAGQRTRNVGRWKWLNVLVTKEGILRRYVSEAQRMVGQAKGGWARAYMELGGRMSKSGWVGRHAGAGAFLNGSTPTSIKFQLINHSAWASGGDQDRIVERAVRARVGRAYIRRISSQLKGSIRSIWGGKVLKAA